MSPLQAWNPALGPNPHYCFPQETTLHMKEKVFSLVGDDFTIKTVAGQEICKCKGKVLTLSDKKVFTDMQGHELFALKNKHFTIHRSFHAEDPHGKDLFVVKGQFSILSSKSTVEFTNAADGRHVEMEINGDWFDRSATISCGGPTVAHISRSFFNIRQIFADKDSYFVTVAPMVDLTMIAALCVCLDEKENDK